MGEIINQYELSAPFQSQNAGFSRWTYATKKTKRYFLKEFLNPVYPADGSLSEKLRKQRLSDCREYEVNQQCLYKAINNASHGNLVRIAEFFRYDSHYYIATERINYCKNPIGFMPNISLRNRQLLCRSIAFEMMNLHAARIVHADIKADNILVKVGSKGTLVGKIVDWDASFFESNPPKYEDELVGDQVYMAPEACQFICGDKVELSCKMDVFSLGILFHQYLTGKMPGFDEKKYDYACEVVLDEQQLKIDTKMPIHLQEMLQGMLTCDPERRFSMARVYDMLTAVEKGLIKKTPEDTEVAHVRDDTSSVSDGNWFHRGSDLL